MTTMRRCLLCALLAASPALAADEASVLRDAGPVPVALAGTEDDRGTRVYIVQLKTPSVAEHQAALAAKAAPPGAAAKPAPLDRENPAVKAYADTLGGEQERVLTRIGAGARLVYSYRYSLNGFAADMTPAQAQKIAHLPEVQNVWEDEIRPLATNHSPQFLGLFDATDGLRSVEGLDGSGVVIGIIDSGIAPEHPALADTRPADRPRRCASSWGETTLLGRWLCRSYRRAPDVILFDPPDDWNGACIAGQSFTSDDCNNKLIGARWFVEGALATGPLDDGEIRSARDADGHGTHTATTAAGNRTSAAIFGTRIGDVEGIAPKARVAVYKACWLRPGDLRASCNTSDLANAIDAAVADGVDVINYSVGSSLSSVTAPDDLALMNAAKAGVIAVVAAGNEGPNFGTIGSPAGGPWVITAAASTRDGNSSVEAIEIKTPRGIAGRIAAVEARFTPPLSERGPIEGSLVLVDDDDATLPNNRTGTTNDACQALVNDADVSGNIALIQRSGCPFDEMVANAAEAGAVAAIVYNIAGDPIVMHGDEALSDIPALMIGQADANLILAEFDAGRDVTVLLNKGLLLTTPDDGNVMASFSARGPAPIADILKPDVTAPGVNILAGFTPDAANATPGENFAYLSGTSMSTPHVAGAAALIRQAHPDWSPAAVRSALMTSARQDVTASSGAADAIPFDFGAGHIVPNAAAYPGLVYDTTADEYDAFACGTASPVVTAERCAALASGGLSFDATDLNQPAIAVSDLANERTITRRVTNVDDEAGVYTAEVVAPAGMTATVDPSSISLAPGESATFDVSLRYLSGTLDQWRFGSLAWRDGERVIRSPIAVKPTSILAPGEITALGGTGSFEFDVEFGYSGTYLPRVHGLARPLVINGFVANDPTKTFSFRGTDGVTAHVIDVPADQLYLRFSLFDALTDGDDDLDLYVYYCGVDGSSCVELGASGEPTSQEQFNVFRPAAGLYAVLVHGFETDEVQGGPGANYQLLGWAFGSNDDRGNMTASGPAFVSAGTAGTVTVNWTNLIANSIYLGGVSHNTPQGLSALTLVTIGN